MVENKQKRMGKSRNPFSLSENSKKIAKHPPVTPNHDQKISLMIFPMESRSQKVMTDSFPSSNGGNINILPGPGNANGDDWQEEVYQKIKAMKEMYLPELNQMYQKIAIKLQQHDSFPQQQKLEHLEKLNIFKTMLERILSFLQVSKNSLSPHYKEKLGSYEKQIVNFINANRTRKHVALLQQSDDLFKVSLEIFSMESKSQNAVTNSLAFDNGCNSDRPPRPDLASLDLTEQTGHANAGDWQEDVYQKITAMKKMYLPELNETYQKIATKIQQHDSLPQQPKSDQIQKLKIFKTMLERVISFLQVTKNNISPSYKEKLGDYEKQIINFINKNRARNSVS